MASTHISINNKLVYVDYTTYTTFKYYLFPEESLKTSSQVESKTLYRVELTSVPEEDNSGTCSYVQSLRILPVPVSCLLE